MSQNVNNTTHDKHYDILKILAIALGLMGMIILPLSMYAVGMLFAVHLQYSDINSGFSNAGFYQVVYNATHVQEYEQVAQLDQGLSVNMASQDQSTVVLVMLGFGLLADIPLALKLREWIAEL